MEGEGSEMAEDEVREDWGLAPLPEPNTFLVENHTFVFYNVVLVF